VMNLSYPWSVIGQCIRYPEQREKLGDALDRFHEDISDLIFQGILPGPDGEAGDLLLGVWKDLSSYRRACCDAVRRRPSDRILHELGLIGYVSSTEGPAETDCTLVQPEGPFSTGPTFVETDTLLQFGVRLPKAQRGNQNLPRLPRVPRKNRSCPRSTQHQGLLQTISIRILAGISKAGSLSWHKSKCWQAICIDSK
jgi:hypothetical protein